MEGLSSFHIDILMLSCLFDNLKKIIKNLIFFAKLGGPVLIKILIFLILYRSCPQIHSLRLIPAKK